MQRGRVFQASHWVNEKQVKESSPHGVRLWFLPATVRKIYTSIYQKKKKYVGWLFFFCCYCSVTKSEQCLALCNHGLQHTRLPCPSLSPGICSNSCPLSQWCYENKFMLKCPSLSQNVSIWKATLFFWIVKFHRLSLALKCLCINLEQWEKWECPLNKRCFSPAPEFP